MFARSSIRTRLVALLTVPTVILVAIAGLQLSAALDVVSRTGDVERLAQAAQAERDLLHSLQMERAESLETLVAQAEGQPADVEGEALVAARAAVDAAQAEVGRIFAELDLQSTHPRVFRAHQIAQSSLRALGPLRFNLAGGRADARSIIGSFGRPIEDLLAVDQQVIAAVAIPRIADRLQASFAVSSYKDAAFRSADVLRLGVAGALEEQEATQLLSVAETEQETWLGVAVSQLPADEQDELRTAIGDIPEVETLIELLATDGDAAEAMTAAAVTTEGGQGLREVERRFAQTAVTAAAEERSAAVTTAAVYGALALVALVLLLLLLVVLVRNVLRPLRDLTALARGVRETLPDTVTRLAAGESATGTAFDSTAGAMLLGRSDELGDLARAMQATTDEATRVAVGQAATRAGITRTIEDVARREQSLVERQLSLLDQLEDAEDDPDQLAQLFRLDHLATRMRRNAENLLLLASARLPGGHDAAPVPLVDVARTAAAEIEQYDRVDVRVGVFDTVLGYAATPISHLLAEVVENATQFSPPTSRVAVTARSEPGGVVVSVADQGLGMSSSEMADARRKLAEPPLLEAAESRRLGLYVVGLIAARLGIVVDLRPSEGGQGVTVDVAIPRQLFVGSEEEAPEVPTPEATPGRPSLPARDEAEIERMVASVPDDASTLMGGMPELQTPPDALLAMSSLLDAELSTPPDLPGDVAPSAAQELPSRSDAPAAPEAEGRTLSLAAASHGRTVDINPEAISALMDGLSGIAADPDAWAPAAGQAPAPQTPAPQQAAPATWDDVPQGTPPSHPTWAPATPASPPQADPPNPPAQPAPSQQAADKPDANGTRRRRPPASGRAGMASSWSTPFPPTSGQPQKSRDPQGAQE